MKTVTALVLSLVIMTAGCTAPHYIWKQEDAARREINPPSTDNTLLIASRKSEFKQALVDRIVDAFSDQPVYMKIVGIEDLADEDANAYSAVVIINTAMGWTVDVPVEKFLKKYGAMESIIVLTTADGGDVLPDMKKRNIDAISSASVMDQADPLANTIIDKISQLLE